LNLAVILIAATRGLAAERRASRAVGGEIAVLDHADRVRASSLAPGPSLVGKTVVINTRKPDDQTIRGVLHGQHADRWTLREAVYVPVAASSRPTNLVHVPTANIAFVQEIEG
jgi:hypothetical protein